MTTFLRTASGFVSAGGPDSGRECFCTAPELAGLLVVRTVFFCVPFLRTCVIFLRTHSSFFAFFLIAPSVTPYSAPMSRRLIIPARYAVSMASQSGFAMLLSYG
ncbi:Uncharacterised protein [Salmonella enterica subsp. enterica serovar Typhi]|nr:Uncharacterised protein [Salmonella enterica subsp. enterica serovar Typhi]CRC92584.1 Uncharacterised protein [Salmonella enterica subsp. enterica serovar Typhi]